MSSSVGGYRGGRGGFRGGGHGHGGGQRGRGGGGFQKYLSRGKVYSGREDSTIISLSHPAATSPYMTCVSCMCAKLSTEQQREFYQNAKKLKAYHRMLQYEAKAAGVAVGSGGAPPERQGTSLAQVRLR
jgi:hypothetical protein